MSFIFMISLQRQAPVVPRVIPWPLASAFTRLPVPDAAALAGLVHERQTSRRASVAEQRASSPGTGFLMPDIDRSRDGGGGIVGDTRVCPAAALAVVSRGLHRQRVSTCRL